MITNAVRPEKKLLIPVGMNLTDLFWLSILSHLTLFVSFVSISDPDESSTLFKVDLRLSLENDVDMTLGKSADVSTVEHTSFTNCSSLQLTLFKIKSKKIDGNKLLRKRTFFLGIFL